MSSDIETRKTSVSQKPDYPIAYYLGRIDAHGPCEGCFDCIEEQREAEE